MDSSENKRGVRDDDIAVFDDFDYSDDDNISSDPNYLYPAKEHIPADQVRVGKSILDFAREAEEAERRANAPKPEPEDPYAPQKKQTRSHHEDLDLYADMLSDVDFGRDYERMPREQHRHTEFDDVPEGRPSRLRVSDMIDSYSLQGRREKDPNDALRDEKLVMKDRLENDKRPENFGVRQGAEMYTALVDEQELKQARTGFGYLVLAMLAGIIISGLTLLKLNWNGSDMFIYFAAGALAASLLLIIKLKFIKVLSCIYFAVHSAFLIGPGAVKYMTDPVPKPDGAMEMLVYYIIAIAMSAIVCIVLATNMDIDNYYSTPLRRKKRKGKKQK